MSIKVPPNGEDIQVSAEERQRLAEFFSGDSAQSMSDDDSFIKNIRGIPKPVIKWVLGMTTREPVMLDKVMDQVSSKINISLAILVINRLVSLNRIMTYMGRVEDDLFSEQVFDEMDAKSKMSLYRHFDKTMSSFMDFVRKFVVQNNEQFDRRHPADELAGLLRGVDPGVLRKMVEVFRIKGASLTESDIEESMAKPDNPVLAELVK